MFLFINILYLSLLNSFSPIPKGVNLLDSNISRQEIWSGRNTPIISKDKNKKEYS